MNQYRTCLKKLSDPFGELQLLERVPGGYPNKYANIAMFAYFKYNS